MNVFMFLVYFTDNLVVDSISSFTLSFYTKFRILVSSYTYHILVWFSLVLFPEKLLIISYFTKHY